MSDEPKRSEPSANIDGSSLCLSCGICCRGALYPWAMLDKTELEAEETAGVEVISYKDEHAFCLPCGYHNCSDNSCSIYGKRFKVCSRYKCDLLKKALDGEVDLDTALDIVRQARGIEMRLFDQLGGMEPKSTLWKQLNEHLESSGIEDPEERNRRFADLLMDARILSLLFARHFDSRVHSHLNKDVAFAPAMEAKD